MKKKKKITSFLILTAVVLVVHGAAAALDPAAFVDRRNPHQVFCVSVSFFISLAINDWI